jgi:hypothetical protein
MLSRGGASGGAKIITFYDTYCAFFTSGHLDSDNG